MNETCADERVAQTLEAAGWLLMANAQEAAVVPDGAACAVRCEADKWRGFLLYLGGSLVAIVDSLNTDAPAAVEAWRTAGCPGGRAPSETNPGSLAFCYASGGAQVQFLDVRDPLGLARFVAGFHSPDALGEQLSTPYADLIGRVGTNAVWPSGLYPHQASSLKAIEDAILARKRSGLVVMAPGSGKTLTGIAALQRLVVAGYARRVLFLVRSPLIAAETVRLLGVYNERFAGERWLDGVAVYAGSPTPAAPWPAVVPLAQPPEALPFVTPGAGAFVYFATLPEVRELVARAGAALPLNAFDLIIADDCPDPCPADRALAWRAAVSGFDAFTVAFTSTPVAGVSSCGDLLVRYDYEHALDDGILLDYDAVSIRTGVRVFETEEPEPPGYWLASDLPDEVPLAVAGAAASAADPAVLRVVFETVRRYATAFARLNGRFPKTLVLTPTAPGWPEVAFAAARSAFGGAPEFVASASEFSAGACATLHAFRSETLPAVVVSDGILAAGVDLPDVEYVVLLRPVRERSQFELMLGRGLRPSLRIGAKSHCTVFDCFEGTLLGGFAGATTLTADPPSDPNQPLVTILAALEKPGADQGVQTRHLVRRLLRIAREMSLADPAACRSFVRDGDLTAFARELPQLMRLNRAVALRRLSRLDFLALLNSFPSAGTVPVDAS